jgi:hypothetical protein
MDFALCTGDNCPLSEHCKRTQWFEPPPFSWWVKPQYNHQTKSCELFL